MACIKDLNFRKLATAIDMVASGTCKRIELTPDIKVYRVQGAVRIDLKLSAYSDSTPKE